MLVNCSLAIGLKETQPNYDLMFLYSGISYSKIWGNEGNEKINALGCVLKIRVHFDWLTYSLYVWTSVVTSTIFFSSVQSRMKKCPELWNWKIQPKWRKQHSCVFFSIFFCKTLSVILCFCWLPKLTIHLAIKHFSTSPKLGESQTGDLSPT